MTGSVSRQDEAKPVFLSRQDGPVLPAWVFCFVLAKAKFFGVIFWPFNKSFIDQACSVKMAGY